jgi:hypothetical protein
MTAALLIAPLLEVMTAVLPTALLQGVLPARAAVTAEDLRAAVPAAQVAQVAAEAAVVVEERDRLNNYSHKKS